MTLEKQDDPKRRTDPVDFPSMKLGIPGKVILEVDAERELFQHDRGALEEIHARSKRAGLILDSPDPSSVQS